jgi:Flp pilus assembly protein TadD
VSSKARRFSDPSSAKNHSNLGSVCGAIGQLDKAIEQFEAAVRLMPEEADIHLNLGIAYHEKGLREHARTAFETALRLKPDNPEAKVYLEETLKGSHSE